MAESDKYVGKFRAEVLNINDPLMRGRILVKCESVLPDRPELGWAESCFTPGHFFLPRKGDFVWIEFENGDVTLPIWVGIMPTREYVKGFLFSGYGDRTHYDPKIRLIRSANHQGIHWKDGAKSGEDEVMIKDKAGSSVRLESKSGDIILNPSNVVQGV